MSAVLDLDGLKKTKSTGQTVSTYFTAPPSVLFPEISRIPATLICEYKNEPSKISSIETALIGLRYTLRSYQAYENDWDGYEGKAAKRVTVEDVMNFLNAWHRSLMSLPKLGLSGDGHIDLVWADKKIFINANFSGNHKFSYFSRNNKGKEFFGDDIPISQGFPETVLGILRSIK